MTRQELQDRTKAFALRVMRLCDSLPSKPSSRCLAGQLIRSSASVAANYRAACRARSKQEFLAKLQIVIEESDESAFWLELVIESGLLSEGRVRDTHPSNVRLARLLRDRHGVQVPRIGWVSEIAQKGPASTLTISSPHHPPEGASEGPCFHAER